MIAAAGLWRTGRYVGGYDEHEGKSIAPTGMSQPRDLGLGWQAGSSRAGMRSGLVVLAAALGRLAEGVVLVFTFSAGMALVLVVVGLAGVEVQVPCINADGKTSGNGGGTRFRMPVVGNRALPVLQSVSLGVSYCRRVIAGIAPRRSRLTVAPRSDRPARGVRSGS